MKSHMLHSCFLEEVQQTRKSFMLAIFWQSCSTKRQVSVTDAVFQSIGWY